MLQVKLLIQEEISEEKITALKNTLKNYLQIYLPDQKDAWKWIIFSCIYLCFICHKPLHPQEMVHYIVNKRCLLYERAVTENLICEVPAGTVVVCLQSADDRYAYVQMPDGTEGYILKENIDKIKVPTE